jgi:CHAT domain-containing protein
MKGRARPRMHWCPTGELAFLPLHAAGRCSEYVVSSYTPTLTALLQARRGIQPIAAKEIQALLVAEPHSPGLPTLDNVIDEVFSAARVLSPATVNTIAGGHAGARVEAVLDKLLNANLLHLACHGEQDAENALQSGFCLRDGRLTIADLMQLELPQPLLAFLSACETAKGSEDQPNQAVHLAGAMLFVGFRSVIATMW